MVKPCKAAALHLRRRIRIRRILAPFVEFPEQQNDTSGIAARGLTKKLSSYCSVSQYMPNWQRMRFPVSRKARWYWHVQSIRMIPKLLANIESNSAPKKKWLEGLVVHQVFVSRTSCKGCQYMSMQSKDGGKHGNTSKAS